MEQNSLVYTLKNNLITKDINLAMTNDYWIQVNTKAQFVWVVQQFRGFNGYVGLPESMYQICNTIEIKNHPRFKLPLFIHIVNNTIVAIKDNVKFGFYDTLYGLPTNDILGLAYRAYNYPVAYISLSELGNIENMCSNNIPLVLKQLLCTVNPAVGSSEYINQHIDSKFNILKAQIKSGPLVLTIFNFEHNHIRIKIDGFNNLPSGISKIKWQDVFSLVRYNHTKLKPEIITVDKIRTGDIGNYINVNLPISDFFRKTLNATEYVTNDITITEKLNQIKDTIKISDDMDYLVNLNAVSYHTKVSDTDIRISIPPTTTRITEDNDMRMPEIKNVTTEEITVEKSIKHIDKSTKPYTVTYENKKIPYIVTHIEWVDDTETVSKCPASEFDAYTGFAICVAKKAMGNKNKMSDLADYWTKKVPKKREQEAAKKAEQERIAEKRKAEREARFEHRKNMKLMQDRVRAYEAYKKDIELRKEAEKKFGVPAGFNIPEKTNKDV